jgi:hypothetical protein
VLEAHPEVALVHAGPRGRRRGRAAAAGLARAVPGDAVEPSAAAFAHLLAANELATSTVVVRAGAQRAAGPFATNVGRFEHGLGDVAAPRAARRRRLHGGARGALPPARELHHPRDGGGRRAPALRRAGREPDPAPGGRPDPRPAPGPARGRRRPGRQGPAPRGRGPHPRRARGGPRRGDARRAARARRRRSGAAGRHGPRGRPGLPGAHAGGARPAGAGARGHPLRPQGGARRRGRPGVDRRTRARGRRRGAGHAARGGGGGRGQVGPDAPRAFRPGRDQLPRPGPAARRLPPRRRRRRGAPRGAAPPQRPHPRRRARGVRVVARALRRARERLGPPTFEDEDCRIFSLQWAA